MTFDVEFQIDDKSFTLNDTSAAAAEAAADRAEAAAETLSGSVAQIATNTQDITVLKEDLTAAQAELAKKANTDGYYEEMTVGNAEQLVSTVTNADDTPYNFRTTAGSADVGDRAYVDAVVGGTVNLNQLVTFQAGSYTTQGITVTKGNDGSITFNGTATGNIYADFYGNFQNVLTANHKYLFLFENPTGNATLTNSFGAPSITTKSGRIITYAESQKVFLSVFIENGKTCNNEIVYPMCTDLTKTFGTTIADYVYGLETATAGAGVAWLKANAPKIFNGEYIPFNAGTLQSVVGLSEKRNTGLNQWDEVAEVGGINENTGANDTATDLIRSKNYIPVVPITTYYCSYGNADKVYECFFYDADKDYLGYSVTSNGIVATPANCAFMRFRCRASYGTTYKNDICINLHWDGEKDGTYEPYTVHTYAFDPTVELRGVPKLKDGKMYYDGDRYLPDGTVQRRYGIVDLGTLNWTRNQSSVSGNYYYVGPAISDMKKQGDNYSLWNNMIISCGYSKVASATIAIGTASDKTYGGYDLGTIRIKDDSYTDATTFKSAMSGVMLVYELAEPTTETAEPYQQIQICDDFGTEEFVSTSPVPVGHNTRYAPNLRAKLEMSPDSPDGDGVYIVQQSGGENTYIPLASSTTIQNILARLTALEGNTNES